MSANEVDINILGIKTKKVVVQDTGDASAPPDEIAHSEGGSEGNPGDDEGQVPSGAGGGGDDDHPTEGSKGNPGEDDDQASTNSSEEPGEIELIGSSDEKLKAFADVYNRQVKQLEAIHEKLKEKDRESESIKETLAKVQEKMDKADRVRKRKENYELDPVIPAPDCYESSTFDKFSTKGRNQIKDLWHVIPLFDPKTKYTYKIGTFLLNCNRAQKECKLNAAEFLNQMRGRVTGSLVEQFDHWMINNHPPSRVYYDLYKAHCVEVSSEDAVRILSTYKVSKLMDFNSTCEEIARLATITAQRVKDVDDRFVIYNNQFRNTLLSRMPDTITEMMSDIVTDHRINHDTTATADQMVQGMQRHLDRITKVFHASKIYSYDNRKAFDIISFRNKDAGKGDTNSNAKQVNEARTEKTPKAIKQGYKAEKKVRVVQVAERRGGVDYLAKVTSHGPNFDVNVVQTICGSAHPKLERASILKLEESRVRNGHRAEKGRKYCVFCSSFTHTGAEGCNSLYTDSLAKAVATPSQKSCDVCSEKLGKDLHHPSRLCPLRPAMLNAYKRGVIAPVGIFKYFLNKNQAPRA